MANDPIIPDLTEDSVREALIANRGNISKVALSLEKMRSQVALFISIRPEFIVLRDSLREAIVDKAEDNIFAAVENGDVGQSNFVVSTLGKNRGWSNRLETTGADGKDLAPPQIIIRRYGPEDDVEVADVVEP
jgi:hypothetical protein